MLLIYLLNLPIRRHPQDEANNEEDDDDNPLGGHFSKCF